MLYSREAVTGAKRGVIDEIRRTKLKIARLAAEAVATGSIVTLRLVLGRQAAFGNICATSEIIHSDTSQSKCAVVLGIVKPSGVRAGITYGTQFALLASGKFITRLVIRALAAKDYCIICAEFVSATRMPSATFCTDHVAGPRLAGCAVTIVAYFAVQAYATVENSSLAIIPFSTALMDFHAAGLRARPVAFAGFIIAYFIRIEANGVTIPIININGTAFAPTTRFPNHTSATRKKAEFDFTTFIRACATAAIVPAAIPFLTVRFTTSRN